MKIKTFPKYGIVVIENTYDDNELKKLWQDIDRIEKENLMLPPKKTGTAKDYFTGKPLKNNKGTYLNKHFENGIIEHIVPLSEKFFEGTIQDAVKTLSYIHNLYELINSQENLISYYEEEDNYESHVDSAVFTVLTWLYREPKAWEGGILSFPDLDVEIEPKNNRSLIFPSCYLHKVSPVKMLENPQPGYGRFTLSHFGYISTNTQ